MFWLYLGLIIFFLYSIGLGLIINCYEEIMNYSNSELKNLCIKKLRIICLLNLFLIGLFYTLATILSIIIIGVLFILFLAGVILFIIITSIFIGFEAVILKIFLIFKKDKGLDNEINQIDKTKYLEIKD